jgi:D-alanine-D-alanine ligase
MLKKYQKVGVLCGGISREREISLRSGKNVFEALKRLGYSPIYLDPATNDLQSIDIDIAFNILHGQYGEDGAIQAYLEHLGIPYTGSQAASSILSINKFFSKNLMIQHNIPTPKYLVITSPELPKHDLTFPLFVKPLSEGSSVGVAIVDTPETFTEQVTPLFDLYPAYLVEEYIQGQEITVGVLENQNQMIKLPILELIPHNRFYDFDAKYTPGKTDFILPANLSEETTEHCQTLAIKLHKLLNCKTVSRVDMIVHPERGPFVLELNSIPGMTDTSDLPAQAKAAGISFDELVQMILENA